LDRIGLSFCNIFGYGLELDIAKIFWIKISWRYSPLDVKLNWKPQIEKLVTQLSQSFGMLCCSNWNTIPTFQRSNLLFCCFPFLFNSYDDSFPLMRLQNKAVRTLEYDKTKTAVLYSKHKILEIPGLNSIVRRHIHVHLL